MGSVWYLKAEHKQTGIFSLFIQLAAETIIPTTK